MEFAIRAGLCLIHGIFESDYEVDFAQFDENKEMGRSRIAVLIGAIQLSVYLATRGSGAGFVICRWLDIRIGVLVGAILSSGGLLASGYATAVWQLCLAQGAMVGLGGALSFSAAVDMLDYLKETHFRLGRIDTSALAVAAAGLGGGALALAARKLVVSGSTATALRWLALMVLCSQCLGALLMGSANQAAIDENNGADDIDKDAINGKQKQKQLEMEKGKQHAMDADDLYIAGSIAQYQHHANNDSVYRQCADRLHQTLRNRWFLVSLVSEMLYHASVFVPPILVPGYVSTQLPESSALSGALLLSVIWFASALGGLFISIRRIPAMVQKAPRMVLSLSIWCLWLPAADNWPMLYAFCFVYGLCLGAASKQSEDDLGDFDLISAWVRALGCAISVMIGVPVASWLFVGIGSGTYYVPAIAFAAAASLGAAVVSTVARFMPQ
ncbi:hypothetical protein FB645_002031 [Coemansia sp. IMI 203386]|nr:hypothetical protein FB645_002031 [Coemansia sp. IMI 203386]